MQKRALEITVGLFFLLGIAAFIVLALKVSGLGEAITFSDGYTITADFENIGGLKPRARVTIAGVSVGRVTSIKYDPKEYLAHVTILVDDTVKNIPEDSNASILTAGLLGDNYIGLTPGFSDTFLKVGGHISVNNTNKAVVLEELVSKFLANQASGLKKED